jgi:hypothetical protein
MSIGDFKHREAANKDVYVGPVSTRAQGKIEQSNLPAALLQKTIIKGNKNNGFIVIFGGLKFYY